MAAGQPPFTSSQTDELRHEILHSEPEQLLGTVLKLLRNHFSISIPLQTEFQQALHM